MKMPTRSSSTIEPRSFLRRLICGIAIGAFLCVASGGAQARPAPRAGISVDVRPLLEAGLGGFAEMLRADLERALADEFAGRLGPGQRIIVQIRSISLNDYGGIESLYYNNDYLDGTVTLIGPDGREVTTQKILTVLPASYGGPWYIAGTEQRRAAGLARSFASWARRYTLG
jgi:hypothetical protein